MTNPYLKILENYESIINIILPTLRKERRERKKVKKRNRDIYKCIYLSISVNT